MSVRTLPPGGLEMGRPVRGLPDDETADVIERGADQPALLPFPKDGRCSKPDCNGYLRWQERCWDERMVSVDDDGTVVIKFTATYSDSDESTTEIECTTCLAQFEVPEELDYR